MNGPAPTGLRLKSQVLGFLVASHFLSAVGEGIMPASDASAHGNAFHGSVSVTFTVRLSTASMLFTKAMNEFVFWELRGQAQIVSHAGAPGVPDRCRFMPNTTAAAS